MTDRIGVFPRLEPPGRGGRLPHPVEPERAPVVAIKIPRHQVPPAAGRDHPHRLDRAHAAITVASGVVEPHPDGVPARPGEGHQQLRVDHDPGAGERVGGAMNGPHFGAQARRHHLIEFRQRAQCGFVRPSHSPAGRQPQRHRGRDRLLVVEQQRRESGAGPELIAATDSGGRMHRVAEHAQPLHVPAHRAVGDPQLGSELDSGPHRSALQQGQQPQHPRGGRLHGHPTMLAQITDRSCPLSTPG